MNAPGLLALAVACVLLAACAKTVRHPGPELVPVVDDPTCDYDRRVTVARNASATYCLLRANTAGEKFHLPVPLQKNPQAYETRCGVSFTRVSDGSACTAKWEMPAYGLQIAHVPKPPGPGRYKITLVDSDKIPVLTDAIAIPRGDGRHIAYLTHTDEVAGRTYYIYLVDRYPSQVFQTKLYWVEVFDDVVVDRECDRERPTHAMTIRRGNATCDHGSVFDRFMEQFDQQLIRQAGSGGGYEPPKRQQ